MKFSKAAALVFLVLALTYVYFYQEPGANGNSRLALTMAIVKEGRLEIDNTNTDAGGYKTVDLATYQGHFYTDKAIGSSVLGAVIYAPIYWGARLVGVEIPIAVEKHLLTFLGTGLPSAFAGMLIYILCEYLSRSRLRAFIVTLAVALGTMSFPFSVIYFGNQLAAALLFGGFFMIFQLRTLPEGAAPGKFHGFGLGLVLGLALLTDMTTGLVVLPLVVYYFFVLWKRKQLKQVGAWLFPLAGGLIPMLIMVDYNLLAYGKPLASGYQYLVNPWFKEAMASGIMGIGRPRPIVLYYETLHPAQGLFWQSPVVLMALVGGFFMLRQKRYWPELLVAAATCGGYLVMNSGYYMWWGGWSFGVRAIVPMLPFLCLPLIFVPRRATPATALLGAISVAQMGIVAASKITVDQYYLERINQLSFFQYSTIYSDCLKELVEGRFAWNIGQAWLGLPGWFSLLPILVILAAGVVIFWRMKPLEA
ncbi:hypothetical protein [Longilinea arvoryzae]|nr:hypothetical protein [Longilinea arvoryzae]